MSTQYIKSNNHNFNKSLNTNFVRKILKTYRLVVYKMFGDAVCLYLLSADSGQESLGPHLFFKLM